jgi:hypothetical protein
MMTLSKEEKSLEQM